MSIINVDDPGPQHTTPPLAHFADAAASAGVHPAYLTAIRDGTPGYRYSVPVARGLTATITLTAAGQGQPPYDTAREVASWLELRAVITDVQDSTATCVLHPGLPAEVATATWTRDGQPVRVVRPGVPRPAARARWRALSAAAPLSAVLGQKLTQVTAAGATAAALLVPLPPLTPTPRPAAPIQAGDLHTGRDHYQPPLPAILTRAPTPAVTPPLLPDPGDDTGRDTAPDLSPEPAPPTGPAVTAPTVPDPTPGPSDTPPPADGGDGDEPRDDPDPSPEPTTPAPSPTHTSAAPSPPSSTTPRPTRQHRPGRHHEHRHKHHRPRRGR